MLEWCSSFPFLILLYCLNAEPLDAGLPSHAKPEALIHDDHVDFIAHERNSKLQGMGSNSNEPSSSRYCFLFKSQINDIKSPTSVFRDWDLGESEGTTPGPGFVKKNCPSSEKQPDGPRHDCGSMDRQDSNAVTCVRVSRLRMWSSVRGDGGRITWNQRSRSLKYWSAPWSLE
jgi:hypothetical protein